MSFFRKLFGGGDSESAGKVAAEMIHEGYRIQATPLKEGGQFRLSGVISREVDGEVKEHKFIRADIFSSANEASEMAFQKAKQVIKERGDGMFE